MLNFPSPSRWLLLKFTRQARPAPVAAVRDLARRFDVELAIRGGNADNCTAFRLGLRTMPTVDWPGPDAEESVPVERMQSGGR